MFLQHNCKKDVHLLVYESFVFVLSSLLLIWAVLRSRFKSTPQVFGP